MKSSPTQLFRPALLLFIIPLLLALYVPVQAQDSGSLNIGLKYDPIEYKNRYLDHRFYLDLGKADPSEYEATFIFPGEFGGERRVEATHISGEGTLWLKTRPVKRPWSQSMDRLRVTYLLKDTLQWGVVSNYPLKLGYYDAQLEDIMEIELQGAKHKVTNNEGKSVVAKLTGLEEVELQFETGQSRVVNLQEADLIALEPVGVDPSEVPLRIEVTRNGQLAGTYREMIPLQNSPPEAVRITASHRRFQKEDVAAARLVTNKVEKFPLPGNINRAVLAGDDRYLIMSLPDEKEVLVFDIEKRLMEGSIVLDTETRFEVIAGRDCVVVAFPDENRFQSYALPSLNLIATKEAPGREMLTVGMGANATEFLLLTKTDRDPVYTIIFLDGKTLEVTKISEFAMRENGVLDEEPWVRASADGRTYGFTGTKRYRTSADPTGQQIFIRGDITDISFYDPEGNGNATPDKDGSFIYTSRGWMTPNLMSAARPKAENMRSFFPTQHPLFVIGHNAGYGAGSGNEEKPRTGVFLKGYERPLIDLEDMPEFPYSLTERHGYLLFENEVGMDQRFLLFPQKNLFILIPPDDRQLMFMDVDLMRMVKESGLGYLYVESVPPESVMADLIFTYHIKVKSSVVGPRFELVKGPRGMEVNNLGRVTWKTESQHANRRFSAQVNVTSKDGMIERHVFQVNVVPKTQF